MADEPDSLVLVHLRRMRTQLQGIATQLQDITAKLEEHDRRFDEFHPSASRILGLGATNVLKALDLEGWQRCADSRLDRIERRLGRLEEKSDA